MQQVPARCSHTAAALRLSPACKHITLAPAASLATPPTPASPRSAPWPNNAVELRSAVERAAAQAAGDRVVTEDLLWFATRDVRCLGRVAGAAGLPAPQRCLHSYTGGAEPRRFSPPARLGSHTTTASCPSHACLTPPSPHPLTTPRAGPRRAARGPAGRLPAAARLPALGLVAGEDQLWVRAGGRGRCPGRGAAALRQHGGGARPPGTHNLVPGPHPTPRPQLHRLRLCGGGAGAVPGPAGQARLPGQRRGWTGRGPAGRVPACSTQAASGSSSTPPPGWALFVGARLRHGLDGAVPSPARRSANWGLNLFWAWWWPLVFISYLFLGRVWCSGEAPRARACTAGASAHRACRARCLERAEAGAR